MSLGLNKTKRRIASVKGTQKITKAMGMIATVKLGKLRSSFENGKDYINSLEDVMNYAFAFDQIERTHYSQENENAKGNLYIVITSSLGLCAAYNSNIFKFVNSIVTEDDEVAPIGTKGVSHFNHDDKIKNVNCDFSFLNGELDPVVLTQAVKLIKDGFNGTKYRAVYLIYTKYINSLKFEPNIVKLLPFDLKNVADPELIPNIPFFEPSPREMIHMLLPLYLSAQLKSKLIESSLSEQASRRTAMDNANDNADEILEKLTIEYNKARQAAITQEITEVVSGANAQ